MTRQEIRSQIREHLRLLGIDDKLTDYELDIRINQAKDRLASDVGGFNGRATRTTTSGTMAYKLPTELIRLERVELDSEVVNRVYTDAILQLETTTASGSWTVSSDTGL